MIQQQRFILIVLLTILMIGCNTKSKRFVDRLNDCVYDDKKGMIEESLYPFDINNSNSTLILDNCYNGVKIDSIIDIQNKKDTNLIFSLTDKTSAIKYYDMFYKIGSKKDLKLYQYSITTNIIKFKNGIMIGMQRDDFFNKIKRDYVNCDTFEINIGLSGFYYYFVFRNDSLIRIDRKMVTM
jgi:hypothetical protein